MLKVYEKFLSTDWDMNNENQNTCLKVNISILARLKLRLGFQTQVRICKGYFENKTVQHAPSSEQNPSIRPRPLTAPKMGKIFDI